MPIIKYLQSRGHTVLAAGNDWQRAYLTRLFPHLITLPLQGYGVKYGRSGMRLTVLKQLPKIAAAVLREQAWLKEIVETWAPDGIISDNRYGLHHARVPSVIITHQLQILSGLGRLADRFLLRRHYRQLARFGEVWVPDMEGPENLAGRLSQPKNIPAHARYIGPLSALESGPASAAEHYLVLLSGPEPQRTLLSNLLWGELNNTPLTNAKIVFVEGRADAAHRTPSSGHIRWYPHLAGPALQEAMSGAQTVICRSGYSTLMDLVQLQKRAWLIPTPGQTEQEYLAALAMEKGHHIQLPQSSFSLRRALATDAVFEQKPLPAASHINSFPRVVDDWLARL